MYPVVPGLRETGQAMGSTDGTKRVAVIGAGSVGISTAIHLQQRGWTVTLVDRRAPASETSFGNAGVINAGSMVPLNNPDLHRDLLRLLRNDSAALRYRPLHLLRHAGWLLAFLHASKSSAARRNSIALHTLTAAALDEHRALMQRTGNAHRFSATGWLKVFRDGGPERAARVLAGFGGAMLRECGIDVRMLDADALRALEPALKPVFTSGFHLVSGGIVDQPGLLLREHAARFVADGGELVEDEVIDIGEDDYQAWYRTAAGVHRTDRLVIAAGPWSDDLLAMAGYAVQLAVERGYHAHFALADGVRLHHSVHDIDASYVMGPMDGGLRVTTGVELAPRDAPSDFSQLEQVTPRVAEAIAITGRTGTPPWRGARPVLPDGVPAIGALPGSQRLWANFGHHHIGLMTGPVSGRLLAELVTGETPLVDPRPFRTARWIRRRRAARSGRWRWLRLGAG